MSKERLEEVKDTYQSVESLIELRDFKQADIAMCYLVENFGKWLIEQAERKIELENEIKSHAPHGRNYTNEQYVELLIETNRLKEENEELAVAHENALREISVLKKQLKG